MTMTQTRPMGSAELKELRQAEPDLRVIDVRTGGEFETVHIPGSYNIPLDSLSEHVSELAAIADPLVLVCQSGARAREAHSKLDAAGKSGLSVLEGGIAAWQNAGGEVANGNKSRWAMDRQVRLVAGSLILAGMAASVVVPKSKWLSAGVGGGLFFSAVSNTCAMANVLGRLPYNQADTQNINEVLEGLTTGAT